MKFNTYEHGDSPNNSMITLFSTLPPELRFELLHYLPISDLSKFNLQSNQSLNDLVHTVNWNVVLNAVVDDNNLELVKLACEHGANGARDNHGALRKAIKYGHKESAMYLWNRFPL